MSNERIKENLRKIDILMEELRRLDRIRVDKPELTVLPTQEPEADIININSLSEFRERVKQEIIRNNNKNILRRLKKDTDKK